jgi:hypothetical protein
MRVSHILPRASAEQDISTEATEIIKHLHTHTRHSQISTEATEIITQVVTYYTDTQTQTQTHTYTHTHTHLQIQQHNSFIAFNNKGR